MMPIYSCSVLIVIVNYKAPQLTIDCLGSLVEEASLFKSCRVVVVDNASRDDSGDKIQTAIAKNQWDSWVTFIQNDFNAGYAYGNNLAIRPYLHGEQRPDYVLLLNPDTVIRPQAIAKLVEFMDHHPKVGITGSRLEDPDATPQCSAFRFPSLASEIDSGLKLGLVSKLLDRWIIAPPVVNEACQTDWVAGASMMVRTDVFEQIGLMDEAYFLYFEEVDFCLQAARQGWGCWYVPESRVVHFVGQSTGVTTPTDQPKRLPQYWLDSRKRYFQKNYGNFYRFLADTLLIITTFLWKCRRQLQRKPATNPPYFIQDIYRNSAWAKLFNPVAPPSVLEQNNLAAQHQARLQSESLDANLVTSLGLGTLIKEDLATHGGDWTRPGFQAIALQRFGAWRMTIKFKLFRLPFSLLYKFFYTFIRNVYGIELPYTVKLGRRVILEHQHGIVIHGNCVIGDDCIIRQGVTIGNRYVEKPFDAPILGDRVNIGAGAKVLGKITLEDDVNIGANAVILKSVPAGKTAVGIPAKIIN